eukprot:1159676-Pelagomonas_calceolata.AAC.3
MGLLSWKDETAGSTALAGGPTLAGGPNKACLWVLLTSLWIDFAIASSVHYVGSGKEGTRSLKLKQVSRALVPPFAIAMCLLPCQAIHKQTQKRYPIRMCTSLFAGSEDGVQVPLSAVQKSKVPLDVTGFGLCHITRPN